MHSRQWKIIFAALGLSLFLSACLKIEGTTTVLEDGHIIDRLTIQPKNSMLFLLSVNQQLLSNSLKTANLSDRGRKKLMKDFSSAADACTIASILFDKEEYLQHKIPYSVTAVPTDLEISHITMNGCLVQIGPYDPRKLPRDFVENTMGMSVKQLSGPNDPYKLESFETDRHTTMTTSPYSNIDASCELDIMPDICKKETLIAANLLQSIIGGASGEFSEMISNENVLLGLAEIARLALNSISVVMTIPDNIAVSKVSGAGDFTYGEGWKWRGSAMELLSDSDFSLEVRPKRGTTP